MNYWIQRMTKPTIVGFHKYTQNTINAAKFSQSKLWVISDLKDIRAERLSFFHIFFRSDTLLSLSFLIWAFGIYYNQVLKLFPQLQGRKDQWKLPPGRTTLKTHTTSHQKVWTKTTVNGNTISLWSPTMHPTGVFPKWLWKCIVLTERKMLIHSNTLDSKTLQLGIRLCIHFIIFAYSTVKIRNYLVYLHQGWHTEKSWLDQRLWIVLFLQVSSCKQQGNYCPLLSSGYTLIYISHFSQCQINCGTIPTHILVFSSMLLSNSSARKVSETFLVEE